MSQLKGEVGSEVSAADAKRAARATILDLLAIIRQDIGAAVQFDLVLRLSS